MTEFSLSDAWDAATARLQSENCPDGFIDLHNGGHITTAEVLNSIWKHCADDDSRAAVVQRMAEHPEEWVRNIADAIQDAIERGKSRVTGITAIANTSPLQPGVRMRLKGGYDSWWLRGNECYRATFVRFVSREPDEMPVAFVELDSKIHLVEGCGTQHRGKFALLKLLFVTDWAPTEVVTVHIVEQLPSDVAQFYESHPYGTEIESHARYRIETSSDT